MRWTDGQSAFAAELREAFLRDNQGLPPFLFGVGIWFGPVGPSGGNPAPLFVVDENEVLIEPLVTVFAGEFEEHEPERQRGRRPLVVGRVRDASERVLNALGGFRGVAVVIACERPEPMAQVGSVLLDPPTNGRATVGVPVIRDLGDGNSVEGFLTAGHAVSGVGTQVHESRRKWASRGAALGRVSLHSDPVAPPGVTPTPGFDIAVVDLDPSQQPLSPVSSGVTRLPSSPPIPEPIRIRGAFTRNGLGMICASLMGGGGPRRQWKDCWIMVPGQAVQGDSGGCVITTPGQELVGMLVGGARQGGSSQYAFHYVQDHDSLEQAVLAPGRVRLK